MSKKAMTIEDALRWAYREELPKREFGGADGANWLATYVELGTRIDVNAFGVVPYAIGSDAPPHPDAVKLWQAVQALDALEIEAPEGWNPIADLGDLGALGAAAVAKAFAAETVVGVDGKRRFKVKPSRLIVHFAVLGDQEEWRAEPTTIATVTENGKPKWFRRQTVWVDRGRFAEQNLGHWAEVEVSGVDKKRRPYADAYRKYFLDPDPQAAIIARMEWQLWRSAIDMLAEDVDLDSIALMPSALPQWPWESALAAPRVLEALVAPAPEWPRRRAARRATRAKAA
ncbi:MAG: hypothetical protein ABSF67_02820 [Roseiarcus sp.]